ncbi:MAG: 50S ribosomal protein L19 [Sumerlaeia bacterium]
MHPLVRQAEAEQLRTDLPYFRVGDTLKVFVRIVEGEKERIQAFEGLVIGKKGTGIRETFTMRRISFNVGIERIFPLHTPRIESIKVIRRAKVRRAKLYYLRELRGKKARLVERRVSPEKLEREAIAAQSNLLTLVAERTAATQAREAEETRLAAAAQAAEAQAAESAAAEAAEATPAADEATPETTS